MWAASAAAHTAGVARLLRPRVLFAACVALVVIALVAVAAGSSDGPPPLSVATGDDTSDRTVERSERAEAGSTAVTSDAPSDEGPTTTVGSGARRRSTTTTSGGRSSAAPPEVTAPPAPDDDRITFWGQVLDELGRPVQGACARLFVSMRFAPPIEARTKADGTYRITYDLVDDAPVQYMVGVGSCPGERLDVLDVGMSPGVDGMPQARGGEVRRTDFTMELAPTTVDVDVVDPAGRPILGVCVGWYDAWEQVAKRAAVDDRGHVRIDRPGVRSTALHVLGVCDSLNAVYGSAVTRQVQLTGGPNSVRFTVPWSAGDEMAQALDLGWSGRFDVISLSTQPDELDPSCVGSFRRSRWFLMNSGPFPGMTTGQLGGPIAGGRIATALQGGGTFVLWGLDGAGELTEVACVPAGTTISLPARVHGALLIQVIPGGDRAALGSYEWLMGPGS